MEKKQRVYVIENSVFARLATKKLKAEGAAIVFGARIHLWNITREELLQNKRLLNHELTHVLQYKRHGFFWFLFQYLIESLKKGYKMNRFEVEARANEENDQVTQQFVLI